MRRKYPAMLRQAALGCAIGLLATAIAVFAPAATAHATVGDLTCVGAAATVTINPGLTFTTHAAQFSATGTLGTCVSLSHPDITGGTFTLAGAGAGNCATGGSATGSGTVFYNNPAHSTGTVSLAFTATIVLGIPIANISIHMTGGPFAGDNMTAIPLTANLNPVDCATAKGLTTATASNVVVIAT